MRILKQLFDHDSAETSGEILFFKIFEFFVAGAVLHVTWLWASYLPSMGDIVHPVGIGTLFDISFLLRAPWPTIVGFLIVCSVLAGFLRLWKGAYAVSFVLLHLLSSARYSLGKVSHGTNLIGMCLLALALSAVFFSDARHRRRFAMGFTYFYVGLAYMLAGVSKLVGTGPLWSDGRHLWMWVNEKGVDVLSKTGVFEHNFLQELVLSNLTLSTLILTFGILTELGAFLIWTRRFRMPIAVSILVLHVGIDLVMSISFYLSMMLLLVIGLPWIRWIDRSLGADPDSALLGSVVRVAARFA